MKNYIILIVSILGIMGLSSCSDFLEEENRNYLSDEILLSDPTALDQMVANAYDKMRLATTFYDLDHQGTDIFTRRDIIAGISELNDYVNLRPVNGALQTYWTNYYNVVAATNTAISRADQVQGLSDADRAVGVGEAKFLRAFAYFHLVENFGGVPLVLEEIKTAQNDFVRASEADVYGQIMADLDDALTAVAESPTQYGKVSKDAVRHLKAKVLLTRGYKDFGSATDFSEAATLAETVIDKHPLVDDFGSLMSIENQRNEEVIFSLLYGDNPVSRGLGNYRHLLFKFVYDVYPGQTRSTLYHRGLGRAPTPYFFSLFEEGDEREEATIRRLMIAEVNGPDGIIQEGDTSIYFPKSAWADAVISSKDYVVFNPDEYFTPDGLTQVHFPMFKKFDDPGVPYTNPGINPDGERDAILIRSGETRLIAAEAYLQAGDADKAAEHINALRDRAGLEMMLEAVDMNIDVILDESAIEMAGEISRWMDLKRTGKLQERVLEYNPHAALNNAIKPFHSLRPIPQSEVDVTGNSITQNDGY
ncbi:RagB/SusD family nutrient uptake outer membrane protein [Echinicola strongylocentroti]|uniref:RagB/SusD family nutrient uptake outer membrane protein n=1 Tax=Echinicola strongylocentroti TaxID=1795355 RepID=A0A2Z4ICP2_9BACT|nr:RagB/SusD family nutrient uptake outer membrane protein [Echinicola strongylocentroti]AWW28751.1 RagB/SusD family nutrient uptake outer membrane protein [Echinicola strongylocentroti]